MWKTNHNHRKIKDLRKPAARKFRVQKNAENVPQPLFAGEGETQGGAGNLGSVKFFTAQTFRTLFGSCILCNPVNKMDNTNCIIGIFGVVNLDLTTDAKHSTIIISNFMYRWVVF